jgi:tetratricopeptide (TPR) repeat protein
VLASSCAYYNTFYLARKYYFKATAGAPYEVDRQGSGQASDYARSIEYSKKVIAQYPKSKWVDNAYLLWAQGLIGRDDPLQTITMLQGFTSRFPKSEQRADATFFLGLAYRNARRYTPAVEAFDDFLRQSPKDELVPYAHLERARALMSLARYAEAGEAAGQIIERWPNHVLADNARRQRAEARLLDGNYDGARSDFHEIGQRAVGDQERFSLLMREADCLESARRYDEELTLLRGELSHTPPPPVVAAPAAGTQPANPNERVVQVPVSGASRSGAAWVASEKYGRLTMRIGTALLLSGRIKESLAEYDHVMKDYPRSVLSAEAQYRIGYAWETGADDFDRALQEYAKVKEQFSLTQYSQQAQQRGDELGRIMQFRAGAGADSLEKKAEAGFLTAERYLFELKRPERALEAYAGVVQQYPGTAVAGRALNAQAWVLSRKMGRKESADSLFWKVIHEYPATEAQLAARDYLEADGLAVPDSLIVPPKAPAPTAADSARALTPIPSHTPGIGLTPGGARADSLLRSPVFPPLAMARDSSVRVMPSGGVPVPGTPSGLPLGTPVDSLGRPRGLFSPPPADTTRRGAGR